uniref:NIN1 (RPN12) binding n=1 Tax=Fundulus heteroclitus TaxID=8078 RepID=A0A3Q2QF80_FUNHE
EIRDRATRRSLAFLPYQLTFKEPHPERIRTVTEFSKKTGDYPSLSATDIKVLALTYQLELEHVGSQHLKTEPQLKVPARCTEPLKAQNPGPTQTDTDRSGQSDQFNSFQFWRDPLPSIQKDLLDLLTDTQASSETAELFNSFQFWRDPLPSIDDDLLALLVRLFCPGSGPDRFCPGPVLPRFWTGPVLSRTGSHSLPLPRGGKHASNPQLVEDQRFPQQRLSRKARQKTDVFDPDYLAGTAPFCQNDVYSRAANLQIRDGQSGGGRRRANPNAARRKFVKKK